MMTDSATTVEMRPQPVGVFPFPASHLLLPPGGSHDALRSLMTGEPGEPIPGEWAFFARAADGDREAALRMLRQSVRVATDEDSLFRYNEFVLDPSLPRYDAARSGVGGELGELLAVAAYATGVQDALPKTFSLDGELLALALTTCATADLERGDERAAIARLKEAVVAARSESPVQAALIAAQIADIGADSGDMDPALAVQWYQEAIRLAADSRLPRLVPELHLRLGMAYHGAADGRRGMLLEAVRSYRAALNLGITATDAPELFAQLQNNLGMAYLAMPTLEANHQLRTAIAIQSFRRALEVCDAERQPDFWASVNVNLANALVYAPSSHPEENLIRAVELYEQVLQVRTRAKDPVAYALVLLNQANALAHLGMFQPALEKLAEAYKLFHWYDQIKHADAARELVERINEHRAESTRNGSSTSTALPLAARNEAAAPFPPSDESDTLRHPG